MQAGHRRQAVMGTHPVVGSPSWAPSLSWAGRRGQALVASLGFGLGRWPCADRQGPSRRPPIWVGRRASWGICGKPEPPRAPAKGATPPQGLIRPPALLRRPPRPQAAGPAPPKHGHSGPGACTPVPGTTPNPQTLWPQLHSPAASILCLHGYQGPRPSSSIPRPAP